jgi:hypothetical protein
MPGNPLAALALITIVFINKKKRRPQPVPFPMSTPAENSPSTDQIRFEISQLEKMRAQIMSDMEAMRAQERNLKAFEARIRDSMPPMPMMGSRPPFETSGSRPAFETRTTNSNPGFDGEWEKLQRARALIEAERRSLTDERLVLREERDILKQREENLRQRDDAIKARETQVALREQNLSKPAVDSASAKATSRTPFEVAKGLFNIKRAP